MSSGCEVSVCCLFSHLPITKTFPCNLQRFDQKQKLKNSFVFIYLFLLLLFFVVLVVVVVDNYAQNKTPEAVLTCTHNLCQEAVLTCTHNQCFG